MIFPSDKYSLLLLADWLEEYGSSYDIVKATAIRNNKYSLDFRDKCIFSGYGNGNGYGYGVGSGNGIGNVHENGYGKGNSNGSYGSGIRVINTGTGYGIGHGCGSTIR